MSCSAICTPPTTPSNGSLYQDSCNNSMLSVLIHKFFELSHCKNRILIPLPPISSCDPSTKSCQWRSCTVLGIPLGCKYYPMVEKVALVCSDLIIFSCLKGDNATHAPPSPCHDDTFCPNSQLRCLPLQSTGSACDMVK
jgi:hypothetical protein